MDTHPHNPVDDLSRILSYQDAIDESVSIHEVASEMYAMSCWTPEFCAALIRAADLVGGYTSHESDPVPGQEISLAAISPSLFEAVQNDMGMRIWPQLQQHWPLIDYHGINDAFIIRYEIGGQDVEAIDIKFAKEIPENYNWKKEKSLSCICISQLALTLVM